MVVWLTYRFGDLLSRRRIAAMVAVVLGLGTHAADARAEAPPRDFVGVQLSLRDVFNERGAAPQADAGIGIARAWFYWSLIETAPSRFEFYWYDPLVAAAAQNGVRILPVLIDPPAFRSSYGGGPAAGMYPPARDADMANFAEQLVDRYGPDGSFWEQYPSIPRVPIRSWEIWNEPNIWPWWGPGPDPAAYTQLLSDVGASIRHCDSHAEIVAAGLPNSPSHLGSPAAAFLDGMYRAGAKGSADSFGIHPYASTVDQMLSQIRDFRAVMQTYGDSSPIWVTEYGWGSDGPPTSLTTTEAGQAQLVGDSVRAFANSRHALGLRGFVYYQWADVQAPANYVPSVWHYSGLTHVDGQPKPALGALRDAVTAIAPADPLSAPGEPSACTPHGVVVPSEPADGPTGAVPQIPHDPMPDSIADQLRAASQVGADGEPTRGSTPASALGVVPGPSVSRFSLRPAAFRAAPRGPALRRRGRGGTKLSFRSSAIGRAELRLERIRSNVPLGPVLSFKARRGRNSYRLLGRTADRRLKVGSYRARLQVIDKDGRRSSILTRRFRVTR